MDTALLSSRGDKIFRSHLFEERVLDAIPKWCGALMKFGAEPPALIMLSIVGVKEYVMHVSDDDYGYDDDDRHLINRDQLLIPAALLETFELEHRDRSKPENVFDLMRPMFDAIWNAAGYFRSLNFDEKGNWKTA